METAIKKAIEGGYDVPAWALVGWERGGHSQYQWRSYLLDPLFWKALSKALGWYDDSRFNSLLESFSMEHVCMPPRARDCFGPYGVRYYGPHWKANWINFILHCAEGKDAESFFDKLLK